MDAIRKLYYEVLSGPQRQTKKFILLAFAGLVFAVIVSVVFGTGIVGLELAGIGYIIGMSVLQFVYLTRTNAKLNDLHYELTMSRELSSKKMALHGFYNDGAAANPSLVLHLMKVLELCRPRRILELGSGQTTRLLAAYHHEHPGTYILTLEHDEQWHRTLTPTITIDDRCHDFRHAPLSNTAFSMPFVKREIRTEWYSGVDAINEKTFELIIVDGPNGADCYSRSGILRHLPQILAPSFVLMFDDAERPGEIMTIDLVRQVLERGGREYFSFEVNGVKRQVIFCSPDLGFLRFT